MKTIYLIPLLLLSACASSRTPRLLNMSRPVPGTTLPGDDIESVRYSENIKAYNVGRYVDPNNALVIHGQVELAPQRARHGRARASSADH
jgi:hypothetical protein